MPSPAKPPTCYFVPGELSSPKFAHAFASGCKSTAVGDLTLRPGPSAGFWTPPLWPLLSQVLTEGREYYYADHAFWRRGSYFRVAKNANQYQVTERDLKAATPKRFELLRVDLAPDWQRNGNSIVICPNSPAYMARYGINASEWVVDLVRRLGAVTDRPIVIRWKTKASVRPLYLDLHMAWMVIVFSSNAAIEALAAGVPVCVFAPWATSAPMGISSLESVESPYYPEHRIPFLWALANKQWTLAEMATGMTWRQLHE